MILFLTHILCDTNYLWLAYFQTLVLAYLLTGVNVKTSA
jgi:hypothetical protein